MKLCAANFGDVTSRKRWFYSSHLLHVMDTPGPRRIRDIRDYDEDERVIEKRTGCKAGSHRHYDDGETLDTVAAHTWHGHDIRGSGKLIGIVTRTGNGNDAKVLGGDEMLPSLTSGSWNNTNMTAARKAAGIVEEDGFLGGLTSSSSHRGAKPNGSGNPVKDSLLHIVTHRPRVGSSGTDPYATIAPMDGMFASQTGDAPRAYSGETLKLGLRGNSASASAFNDDELLGSLLANSFHGNEASKLEGCRNPSILEMARAHSIPDSFDWARATKTDKGKMIANSWPVGMATAACRAMLVAMGAR